MAVTPGGSRVISGSEDHTLRVWDLAKGETTMMLKGHTSAVNAVAVTPDGHYVVSGSFDHTLRVWDLATGQTTKAFLSSERLGAPRNRLEARRTIANKVKLNQ